MARPSFETWMSAVNSAVESRIGLSADDLPDCCYYDWYEDGVTPSRAATMAIQNAGGDLF